MKYLSVVSVLLMLGVAGPAAAQDAAKGTTLFQQRCAMCHAVKAGAPARMGPNLFGVTGRKAGTLAGYAYSPAMAKAGIVWDAQSLDTYLQQPRKLVAGTKMAFAGLPNPQDRQAVIAYLKTAK